MPDPYWQWDWFLFNALLWGVPSVVFFVVRGVRQRRFEAGLRRREGVDDAEG